MRCFSRIGSVLFLVLMLLPLGAIAQVGPSGTVNAIIADGAKSTYGVVGIKLTPAATPTDLAVLYGATGSTIRVKKVTVSGVVGAGTMDVSLVKRTDRDTAGTVLTTGSAMTPTPANVSYGTGTVSAPNVSSAVWGSGTQTLTYSLATLTIGKNYVLTFTPTVTGQVPTITATSGISKSLIPKVVTAVVNNVFFTASATTAVFTFTNTATSTWSTASTTCYETLGGTVAKYDSRQAAEKATLVAYTANPTVGTGAAVRNKMLNFGAAGAAGVVTFDFSTSNDKPMLLLNGNQGLAIYLNGQALPSSGVVSYDFEWEESTP